MYMYCTCTSIAGAFRELHTNSNVKDNLFLIQETRNVKGNAKSQYFFLLSLFFAIASDLFSHLAPVVGLRRHLTAVGGATESSQTPQTAVNHTSRVLREKIWEAINAIRVSLHN